MFKLSNLFSKIKNELNQALFPPSVTCDCCNKDIFQETYPAICQECYFSLPFINNPCNKCGKPLNSNNKCKYCFYTKSSFTQAFAVFDYLPPLSPMVFRFKYGKEFHLKNFFNHFLVNKFSSLNINPDCVIAVPMHRDKEILRIKNQSALLVEEFCNSTKIENASDKIIKVEQLTQTTLDFIQRFENVKSSLFVVNPKYFKNKSILIIDDIFTTGATANAISEKLFECEANKVYILTICSTGEM